MRLLSVVYMKEASNLFQQLKSLVSRMMYIIAICPVDRVFFSVAGRLPAMRMHWVDQCPSLWLCFTFDRDRSYAYMSREESLVC